MSSKLTSLIWNHFSINAVDNSKATCKYCNASVSRGGAEPKNWSTSNLVSHLRNRHIPEHGQYMAAQKSKEAKDVAVAQLEPVPSTSSASPARSLTAGPRQPTLAAVVDRTKKWDANDPRALSWDKTVAEFVVLDYQPFSVVEDIGFRRLMDKAEPRYTLIDRKKLSATVIPGMYFAVRSKIKLMISTAKHISFTSDAWSDPSSGVALLSLTAHWISDDFVRQNIVLCAEPLSESHTGDYLAGKILLMLESFAIGTDRVHVVLRDGGANMVKAMRVAELPDLSCFAHTLQLVVHDCILSQRAVIDVLAVARQIVGKFRHSILAQDRLKVLQERLKLPKTRLVQDVLTRWNSTYAMLDSLIKNKTALAAFSAEHELPALSADQWILIDNITYTLAGFDELTKDVSAGDASAGLIMTTLSLLRRHLSAVDDKGAGIRTMRSQMLASLNKRFAWTSECKMLILATMLDPRWKAQKFYDDAVVARGRQWLAEEACAVTCSDVLPEQVTKKARVVEEKKTSSIWDLFDDEPAATSSTADNDVDQMIDRYLAMPLLDRRQDPFIWWRQNGSQFAPLARLARKYLSAPASSVPSEQLFSGAGKIYSPQRKTLKAEKGQMLLFLKYNLPKIDFIY